ncbi:alpha-protein kinase 3-like isoform X2 [Salvelinus fontinalis]|uniref:alpha-protein kinase 3-like isoform X2 n=1 Tax=Salvelinus fontinalis TaxID=8038 RepID=UPI002486AA25|nr:alpha-protein kinase 3-like isoform X2 [Salvelinus fontinalis]
MSSRRLMTRSYSVGDGRSSSHNGDDVIGSSRASSRSYLSDVRPENRSTLHCVMAHLTEETQPSFETTLKSRAVSETCSIKFTCEVSGHPAPEVTWYKDDLQLDRYCGLPKYNISRNGQNHSLHIYNCTMEDAAIYQASARNNKGIVSCSGVLEVGTMSEYKIHQQYFAKIKLKAEKTRRELEEPKPWDKENHGSPGSRQETLRTISPDRSQRKRRSPMDPSLSAPSFMEDEVVEESTQAHAGEAEARLQDTPVVGEEKRESNRAGSSNVNRQAAITENSSNKGRTYVYDSVEKSFAPHTPKTSLAKKKIKISNGEDSGMTADSQAGKKPEERGMSKEGEVSVTPCLVESSPSLGSSEEALEVESAVETSASKTESVKYMNQSERAPLNNTVSVMEEVKVQVKEKVPVQTPPHNGEPSILSPSTGLLSTGETVSGNKSQNAAGAQVTQDVGNNNIMGSQSTVPPVTSSQPSPSAKLKPQPSPSAKIQPQPSPSAKIQPQPSPPSAKSQPRQPSPPSAKSQPQPRQPSPPSEKSQSQPRQPSPPSAKPQPQPRQPSPPSEKSQSQPHQPSPPSVTSQPQPRQPSPPSAKSQSQPHQPSPPSVTSQPQPSPPSVKSQPQPNPPSAKLQPHPLQSSPSVKSQLGPSVTPQPDPPSAKLQPQPRQPSPSPNLQRQPSSSVTPQPDPPSAKLQLQPQPQIRLPSRSEKLQASPYVKPQPQQSPSAKLQPQPRQPSPSPNLQRQPSSSVTPQPQASPSVTTPQVLSNTPEDIKTHQSNVTDMEVDDKPSVLEHLNSTTTPLKGQTECLGKDSASVLEVLNSDTYSIHGTGTAVEVAGESVKSVLTSPCKSSEAVSALPQRLCEQSGDQLSVEETSTCLKNVSLSRLPAQLGGEVTQNHRQTEREWNGTPVGQEPVILTIRRKLDGQSPSPQQRSPSSSDREVTANANKRSPTLHNPPSRSASDKMTQGTQDHSRGSSESHTLPFTEPLKSPLESPGVGEKTLGCSVSSVGQQGEVKIAIKTVGETEIQVDVKVQGNHLAELHAQGGSYERRADMETVYKVSKVQEGEIERLTKAPEKKTVESIAVAVWDEKSIPVLKIAECQGLSLKPRFQPIIPDTSQTADTTTSVPNTNISEQQTKAPTPVAKVMSIADILRSQMEKSAPTEVSPVPPISVAPISVATISMPLIQSLNTDQQPKCPPSTDIQDVRMQSPELRMDETEYRQEPEKDTCKKETDTSVGSISASNVEYRFNTYEPERFESPIVTPMTEASPKAFVIPPISIVDMDGTLENSNPPVCILTDIECVMDTDQEHLLDHNADISLAANKDGQKKYSLVTPEQKSLDITVPPTSISSVTFTAEKQQTLENTVKEMDSSHSLPPVFTSQHGRDKRCASPLSERSTESSSLPSATENQSFSTKNTGFTNNIATPTLQPVSEKRKDSSPDTGIILGRSEACKPDVPQPGPQTVRRFDTKGSPSSETKGYVPVPTIPLDSKSSPSKEVNVEEYSKPDSSTSVSVTESSTGLLKESDSVSPMPSATPQELASGARRKILIPKPKGEDPEAVASQIDTQSPQREGVLRMSSRLSPESSSPMSPGLSRRSPLLQPPNGQRTPPTERRSPLLSRRKLAPTPETLKQSQEPALETTDTTKTEEKPAKKDKHNPFKAPQVIRKIRGEPFSDAAGHLKLWCQFFNVLSDSTIKWIKDEVEIAEVKRSAGDETQVALAIVQTSSRDCGVYGCTITNEYGTDTTDFLLSVDILSGMFLREDQEVGEEIEMSPLLFTKGLADSGVWGSKFFGRIVMEEAHIGEGCSHKACRVKVIYGLEPVFESGTTCYIKVKSPIAYYGVKEESNLVERNLAITQQECRLQNIAREYCKIFAAECRVIGTFGEALEVIPVHLIYRPANTIPHATVESDLKGVYLRYCLMDATGRLVMRTGSEAALKCCALQHWILQWTNGNMLLTRMEGVDFKITNVGISIKSKGYQSLTITENPNVFEQFVSQHQCNYYCGLLSLRSLKTQDSLQTPAKPKCSRSPLLHRRMGGSSSPQPSRKATGSPRLIRKPAQPEDSKATAKYKAVDDPNVVRS